MKPVNSLFVLAFVALCASVFASTVPAEPFQYKVDISFPGFTASEELIDFPMPIVIDPKSIKEFDYLTCSRDGIVFADCAGNEIAHEIEVWNRAPDGKSFIWVKVPHLANGTTITMYCAPSADVPRTLSPTDVWSGYMAVWHMVDPDLGGVRDSTGNGHDLTISQDHATLNGGIKAHFGAAVGTGEFSQGYTANSLRDAINGAMQLSMEALWKSDRPRDNPRLVSCHSEETALGNDAIGLTWQLTGTGWRPQLQVRGADGKRWAGMENKALYNDYRDRQWGTASLSLGADGRLLHYMNKFRNQDSNHVDFVVSPWNGVNLATNADMCIGMRSVGTRPRNGWNGAIDELRISSSATARSPLWHETFHASLLEDGYVAYGEAVPATKEAIIAGGSAQPHTTSADFAYFVKSLSFGATTATARLLVSEDPSFTAFTETVLGSATPKTRLTAHIENLKPATQYFARIILRDNAAAPHSRSIDATFTTCAGIPEFEPTRFELTPEGVNAIARLRQDATSPVAIECWFGTSASKLTRHRKIIREARCCTDYSFGGLEIPKDNRNYYIRFKAVYGSGQCAWSDIASFANEPRKGNLIFADDFSQPLLFAEHWQLSYNNIRPIVEEDGFRFTEGGSLFMRRETPKSFWAEMDFTIPSGAKNGRGGFEICNSGFHINFDGHFAEFRGIEVPGFEYDKPVKMRLIRRRKDKTHSEYIFSINEHEFARKTCEDPYERIRPQGCAHYNTDLKIWASSLPYKVTDFKIWELVDDPRGPSPNLVANSSFESAYDGVPELFEVNTSFNTNNVALYDHYLGLVRVDTSEKHSGKQSLRMEKDPTAGTQVLTVKTGGLGNGEPGVFSVWMKASGDNFPVKLSIGRARAEVKVSRNWERYELLTEGNGFASITFAENGVLWLDDVQVEKVELSPNDLWESPHATPYRASDTDSAKVYFANLSAGDILPKPNTPKRRIDPVAENRAKGLDIDGKPLKPLEVLGRLSFYMNEPEATFRITANVTVPTGTVATLSCNGLKATATVPPSEKRGTRFELTIPIDFFACGDYPVEVALRSASGETRAEGSGILRKLPWKAGATQINHFSRCIVHDGKPVVPVALFLDGLYHPVAASSNAVAKKLNLYAYSGFKTAHALFPFHYPTDPIDPNNKPNIAGPQEFLEGTERRGMYSITWLHEPMKFSDEKLAAFIRYIEPRTNILAHLVLDEPEIQRSYNADQAAACISRMRKADPYHPMFMNQAFFGIPSNYANRESDIFMIDDYLTNRHQMRTVASVVDNAIDMWNYGAEKGVPVWFFLVGANMRLHGREPSYEQQIAQTYGCIAAGCNGFSYFYGTAQTPGNWTALKQLAREIEVLTPAMTSEEACGVAVSDVDDSSLRLRTMRHSGNICLVACNVEDKALGKVRITLPPECASATRAEVLFENRNVKIRKGIIEDDFPRWSRHVYKVVDSNK